MCRWAAYVGKPIYLEDIITRPEHSLVAQSVEASECKTTTNADGLGLRGMMTDQSRGFTAMFIPPGLIQTLDLWRIK